MPASQKSVVALLVLSYLAVLLCGLNCFGSSLLLDYEILGRFITYALTLFGYIDDPDNLPDLFPIERKFTSMEIHNYYCDSSTKHFCYFRGTEARTGNNYYIVEGEGELEKKVQKLIAHIQQILVYSKGGAAIRPQNGAPDPYGIDSLDIEMVPKDDTHLDVTILLHNGEYTYRAQFEAEKEESNTGALRLRKK